MSEEKEDEKTIKLTGWAQLQAEKKRTELIEKEIQISEGRIRDAQKNREMDEITEKRKQLSHDAYMTCRCNEIKYNKLRVQSIENDLEFHKFRVLSHKSAILFYVIVSVVFVCVYLNLVIKL